MRKVWRHVIVNTRCSWLHGSPRGFRSRDHRIHSSGDYKNPPPEGEHAGLHRWHLARSQGAVHFELTIRVRVVLTFVLKLRELGHRVIAIACGADHLHTVVELPGDYDLSRREIGKCKQKASHTVRDALPGSVWSEGGSFDAVNGRDHLWALYGYVREKQEAGSVVWSHRADENWVDDPQVGVVVMARDHARERRFDLL